VPVHQWCYGVPHSAVATPVRVWGSDGGAIAKHSNSCKSICSDFATNNLNILVEYRHR
jgi:hypothetical protein